MELEIVAVGEIDALRKGLGVDDRITLGIDERQALELGQGADMSLEHPAQAFLGLAFDTLYLDTLDQPDERGIGAAHRVIGVLGDRSHEVGGALGGAGYGLQPAAPCVVNEAAGQHQANQSHKGGRRRLHGEALLQACWPVANR